MTKVCRILLPTKFVSRAIAIERKWVESLGGVYPMQCYQFNNQKLSLPHVPNANSLEQSLMLYMW